MINILYCGNYAVFDGILISILSMIKHTKEALAIHIFTMDLYEINRKYQPITNNQKNILEKIVKEKNIISKVILHDITKLFTKGLADTPNLVNFYTPYCLLRLFADKVEGIADKVIYLDTDTVINDDIKKLYDIEIEDYELACVRDYLGKVFISPRYFNSGVLLLNMVMIRKTNLFENTRKLIANKKMAFPDQTALNKLAKRKLYIPAKFNSQRRLKKDTIIQHFCKSIRFIPYYHTLNIKPWEIDKVHKKLKITHYDDIFAQYFKIIKTEGINNDK